MDIQNIMDAILAFLYGAQFSTLAQIERMMIAIFYAMVGKSCPLFGKGVREFFWLLAVIELFLVLVAEVLNVVEFLGWVP